MTARTLSLIKGGHKYVFRYSQGCEDEIVDAIAELAARDDSPIDWLDAATLGFQVTQGIAADCTETLSGIDEKVL